MDLQRQKQIATCLIPQKVLETEKDLGEGFFMKTFRAENIPKQRQDVLANKCFEITKKASLGASFEDVRNHLFGGKYDISLLKKEGIIQGFGIFATRRVGEDIICILHGIALHPKVQGLGLAKKCIHENILQVRAHYLALRTRNPSMYKTAFSLSSHKKNVYPNFEDSIPSGIIQLSNKLGYFNQPKGELCPRTMIVREAYTRPMVQQFWNPKNTWETLVQKRFSQNELGKNDAFAILIQLT